MENRRRDKIPISYQMKEAYINCTGDNSRSGMRDKASVFDENQNIYMSPQVCKIKGSH